MLFSLLAAEKNSDISALQALKESNPERNAKNAKMPKEQTASPKTTLKTR